MPRLRDIVGYLWVGAIAAPTLIVGAGTLYHGYNNEKHKGNYEIRQQSRYAAA